MNFGFFLFTSYKNWNLCIYCLSNRKWSSVKIAEILENYMHNSEPMKARASMEIFGRVHLNIIFMQMLMKLIMQNLVAF